MMSLHRWSLCWLTKSLRGRHKNIFFNDDLTGEGGTKIFFFNDYSIVMVTSLRGRHRQHFFLMTTPSSWPPHWEGGAKYFFFDCFPVDDDLDDERTLKIFFWWSLHLWPPHLERTLKIFFFDGHFNWWSFYWWITSLRWRRWDFFLMATPLEGGKNKI